jgi:hypothetical protein
LGLQQLLLPPVSPEERLLAEVDLFRRAAHGIVLGVVQCRAELPVLAPDQLPVFRGDKSTTKIRPVFDGAAKTKFGPSLNDLLETGPNLNPDLLSVLIRFRKYEIAWIADIEKAFLNIALQPDDA